MRNIYETSTHDNNSCWKYNQYLIMVQSKKRLNRSNHKT